MKHLKLFLFCTLLLTAVITLSAGEWFQSAGGTGADEAWGIARDNAGNVYVSGYFNGTATFGSISLTNTGFKDAFVAKLDPNGNWLWARQAGGDSDIDCYDVATDGNGNVYITGTFQNTAYFGIFPLTSAGNKDIYVAKLSTNGDWLWANRGGGISTDLSQAITTDADGNCYITGSFRDTADFGTASLTSTGSSDLYIAKLNTSGVWQWAVNAANPSEAEGRDITWSNSYGLYVTGYFDTELTCGSIELSAAGGLLDDDIFVCRLDADGNWVWAKSAGGNDNDTGWGISVDFFGRIYVTGSFYVSAYFNLFYLAGYGSQDVFVARMDRNGNWLWAVNAGGGSLEVGRHISTDQDGFSYVTGYYHELACFGNTDLYGDVSFSIFVAKLDSSGNWLWARGGSAVNQQIGYSIAAMPDNSCVVAGVFYGTLDFGYNHLVNAGDYDVLVAKIADPQPMAPEDIYISNNGNDVIVTWAAYHYDTWDLPLEPDYFFIYYNTEGATEPYLYLTFVPAMLETYVHQNAGYFSSSHFYQVTAVKIFGNTRSQTDTETWLRTHLHEGMTKTEVEAVLKEINLR